MLEVDGVILAQSIAISRFVANELGRSSLHRLCEATCSFPGSQIRDPSTLGTRSELEEEGSWEGDWISRWQIKNSVRCHVY